MQGMKSDKYASEVEAHILLQELTETDHQFSGVVPPATIERIKLLTIEKYLLRFENQGLKCGMENEDDDDTL